MNTATLYVADLIGRPALNESKTSLRMDSRKLKMLTDIFGEQTAHRLVDGAMDMSEKLATRVHYRDKVNHKDDSRHSSTDEALAAMLRRVNAAIGRVDARDAETDQASASVSEGPDKSTEFESQMSAIDPYVAPHLGDLARLNSSPFLRQGR